MDIDKKMCATTDTRLRWEEIDFKKAEKRVKKLQRRIAEAYKEKKYNIVKNIQHLIIHSFSAKALAVKSVTTNKGSNTPGIDEIVWKSNEDKINAIYSLNRRGYKSNTLKRIYIPKSNGKLRALSIPTMQDRAMQTLYKYALEPIAEVNADKHSYGFRPNIGVIDAIKYCKEILEKNPRIEWMLKIDIKSCFDNISHEWLMNNVPMDKEILKKFLKSPYMCREELYPTINGVPQGGTISSVFCNIALDGIERLIDDKYKNNIFMIRYADDILILGREPQFLVQFVVPTIKEFLAERNLELAEEKTKLVSISQGITFLGWELYKEKNELISIPSQKNVEAFKGKICEALLAEKYITEEAKSAYIRKIIRGWLHFFASLSKEDVLYGLVDEIFSLVNSLGYNHMAERIRQIYLKCLTDINNNTKGEEEDE